jgi:hypothetical protein
MFTLLLTLFALMAVGGICLIALVTMLKVAHFAIHAFFWPFKLLLLPFLLIALVVKLAFVFAFAVVVLAVLIPLGLIVLLVGAPFFLAASLT